MSNFVNKNVHKRENSELEDIIQRLMDLFSAKNHTELCEKSGIGRSTLGNWKSRGSLPKLQTLIQISRQTGASLDYLLLGKHHEPASVSYGSLSLGFFASDARILTRGYAQCSVQGYLEKEEEYHELPAPEHIRDIDPNAFYVVAKGASMIPEGIEEGDHCLVSPSTPPVTGQRIWLKDRQGRACIKRLVDIGSNTYKLRGWLPSQSGNQQDYNDEWIFTNIAEKGVILAVYRGKPDFKNPPPIISDPKSSHDPMTISLTPEMVQALDLPETASQNEILTEITDRLKRFKQITDISTGKI